MISNTSHYTGSGYQMIHEDIKYGTESNKGNFGNTITFYERKL